MDKDSWAEIPDYRPVGIQYSASISSPRRGSFTCVQIMYYNENREWADGTVNHKQQKGVFVDPTSGLPAKNEDGSLRTLADNPVLDGNGGLGYGFRVNDNQMGPDAPTQPGATSSTVIDARTGDTNTLYGNDSPESDLVLPPGWQSGRLTRSDSFTITLMYNPDPNANASSTAGGGPGSSIWVPVGSLTWSWNATVKYNALDLIPEWRQIGADQDPGSYAATKIFPTWVDQRSNRAFNDWHDSP